MTRRFADGSPSETVCNLIAECVTEWPFDIIELIHDYSITTAQTLWLLDKAHRKERGAEKGKIGPLSALVVEAKKKKEEIRLFLMNSRRKQIREAIDVCIQTCVIPQCKQAVLENMSTIPIFTYFVELMNFCPAAEAHLRGERGEYYDYMKAELEKEGLEVVSCNVAATQATSVRWKIAPYPCYLCHRATNTERNVMCNACNVRTGCPMYSHFLSNCDCVYCGKCKQRVIGFYCRCSGGCNCGRPRCPVFLSTQRYIKRSATIVPGVSPSNEPEEVVAVVDPPGQKRRRSARLASQLALAQKKLKQ
jgi:hypothetical protein